MSITRSNLQTAVRDVARINDKVASLTQLNRAINNALRELSRDKPNQVTTALPSDSDLLYTMTDVVGAWGDGYHVRDVKYLCNGMLKPIDSNLWSYYEIDGVGKLKVIESADDDYISTGAVSYYVTYSAPYDTSADPILVSVFDEDALVALAASKVADQAAAEAADQKNSSLTADVVNYQEIIDKWLKIARRQEKIYKAHISATPEGTSSGGFAEWDLSNSLGSMLFHGARRF